MLKKILVVEDNEDNRRILVYRLRKIGQFDIREAANGQQAVEAVQQDPPDLIFMDLKMPVMDGWEATRRIRQMDVGRAVRIIALTAQAMAGDEQKALSIGCDDYLAKPVAERSRETEAVQETERGRHQPWAPAYEGHAAPWASELDGERENGRRDGDLDQPRREVDDAERGERQRDAVAQRESTHRGKHPAPGASEQHEPEHEQ